ncbi:MAG: hypothetical protein LV480_02610 [Methylacidiphilales bacterium]|nr:hypothetical protein [Candidatus Methylacidiphilales bacterium]
MKKYKIEIHSEAKIDFHAQLEYLAENGCPIETLRKFSVELKAARNAILQNPLTWPISSPRKKVRRYGPTPRFRYLIFYVVMADDCIRIIEYAGPGRLPRWTERY